MAEKELIEDGEPMDSGLSSFYDLTSVTDLDETFHSSGYANSLYSWRSSTMELLSTSTTMNFSIANSDMVDTSDDQSMSFLPGRRSPSIKSNHTYTGAIVLMKDFEESNMSYSTMVDDSMSTVQNMFTPYEPLGLWEQDESKNDSSSKLCL